MSEKPKPETRTNVENRMPLPRPDAIPGGRAALPAGTLPTTYLGPQADEQRTPPVGAPAPISASPLIEQELPITPRRTSAEPHLQPVARLSELQDGCIKKANVADTEIVLVRSGQRVNAFGATCPHAGAPLEDGAVCDGRLICPWHKAEFSVNDGTLLEPPALDDLTRYETRLDGDTVLVSVEPMPGPAPRQRGEGRTFVIAGSGAAGTAAAVELRRRGFAGRVLLVGSEATAPYDRTALSKFVLSGDMKPNDVPPLREPDWFASNRVERVTAFVDGIDVAEHRLLMRDGTTLTYDRALLATGATAKWPNLPGTTLRGAHRLRDVADATAILAAAAPGTHAVIAGASFIGLEAASALRKRGVSVTVVGRERLPFERQFGPEIGRMFLELHRANGVAFRMGTEIEALDGNHAIESVRLKGGEVLPADLVLVGVGVEPATKGMKGVATDKNGAVAVDASFRVAADLYAAGDCAVFPLRDRSARIEHWRVAQQLGRYAAAAMLDDDAPYDGVPFFWTYHYGLRFEYLGHASTWDSLHIEGDLDRQDFVALQIEQEAVVGVVACQRERLTATLINRMRSRLPAREAIELIRP